MNNFRYCFATCLEGEEEGFNKWKGWKEARNVFLFRNYKRMIINGGERVDTKIQMWSLEFIYIKRKLKQPCDNENK